MDNSWSHTFQQTSGGLRGIIKRALKYLQDENSCCQCAPPRLLTNSAVKYYFICFRALTSLKSFIFNPCPARNIFLLEYILCVCVCVSTRHYGFVEKNKQFIKLYHKYIHNINEDILQIYSILQYRFPFRRESFQ